MQKQNYYSHINKRALSELLLTNTCVNDWMKDRNPSNKFSVSSHELREYSLSYIRVLILLSSNAPDTIFLHYSSKLQLFSNLINLFLATTFCEVCLCQAITVQTIFFYFLFKILLHSQRQHRSTAGFWFCYVLRK